MTCCPDDCECKEYSHPFVHIEWRDSRRYVYQMSREEPNEVCIIYSCGWLVKETDDNVTIAQDIIDGDLRGIEVIPLENVINIDRNP